MHPSTTAVPPAAIWVARLSHGGVPAPASVGPFASEAEANEWASTMLDGVDDWSWTIDAVISPETLPSPVAPRPRHLRLVS